MEKYNNWKLKFYTIWAGQAVSLITSAILQMAIIFYLTTRVRDKEHHKKLNRQLEKVADSFGNITDI